MRPTLASRLQNEWAVPAVCLAWAQWETWVARPNHLVGPIWALGLAATVGSAALLFRERHPVAVVAFVVAVDAPGMLIWGASEDTATLLPMVIGVYAAGRYGRRPTAYAAIFLGAALILLQQATDPLITNFGASWNWALFAPVIFVAGAWVRQRAELGAQRDAEAAERTRAAAAEERIRIAREVHDVLAHSIGVMVVQAEAAEEMLTHDPARATAPIQRVQESGRSALHEVRGLLRDLRSGDTSETRPGPSLELADDLLVQLHEAGLPLEVSKRGELGVVPVAIAAAAYRVLQESLSNVLKHAGLAPTRVEITTDGAVVEIVVVNDGPEAHIASGGHGLLGMRERVAAVGGQLHAAPRAVGGFEVRATFPIDST